MVPVHVVPVTPYMSSLVSAILLLVLVLGINFLSTFPGSPLGKTGYQISQETEIKNRAGQLEAETNYWQKTIVNYPGFRDAYLRLFVLNWRLGNTAATEYHRNKVLEIDPNNPVAGSY